MESSLKESIKTETCFACSYKRGDDTLIAKVVVPYNKINKVIFYGEVSNEEKLVILYMVADVVSRGMIKPKGEVDLHTVATYLSKNGVSIYQNLHDTADLAIKDVEKRFDGAIKIDWRNVQNFFGIASRLKITSLSDDLFSFWKSIYCHDDIENSLYIIPPYHPYLFDAKRFFLINGSTNRLIGDDLVDNIYCPEDCSRNDTPSWGKTKHPYYAKSKTFELTVDLDVLLTSEGVAKLFELIESALQKNGTFVEVTGGFDPPFECAHNVIVEKKIESPYWKTDPQHSREHYARGSEDHCVWSYRTLQDEGLLDKAKIPNWFLNEGWLKIYEDIK